MGIIFDELKTLTIILDDTNNTLIDLKSLFAYYNYLYNF